MSYLTNLDNTNTISKEPTTEDEIIDLKAKIEDLKGQLNVAHLQLKDNSFNMKKKQEAYDMNLDKLTSDNTILREKIEK